MLHTNEILLAFSSVILLIASALLLGKLTQWLCQRLFYKSNHHTQSLSLFWYLLIGTSLLLSIYAIVHTKGITMLFPIPILVVFFTKYLLNGSLKNKLNNKGNNEQWTFLILSIVFNFVFYVWAIQSFNQSVVNYVSGDFTIYYRIAHSLNQTGIENLSLDPIYLPNYASPYHYGDLWLYALISKFFSLNPSFVFLASFTFLSIIFVNALYTFIKIRFFNLSQKNNLIYLVLLGGLFTGFNFFFPKFIVSSAEPYTLSVMNWSKVLTPSYFLITLLILSKSRNWKALSVLAMIGALSFINAMPAMFLTVFFTLTLALIRKDISLKSWIRLHILFGLLTLVFLIVLYKVLPRVLNITIYEYTAVAVGEVTDKIHYLLTAVKIFIGGWFQVFVLTPFVLITLVVLYYKDKLKGLVRKLLALDYDLLFMFFALMSGLICWAIMHPFAPDSVQFFTNILAPIYSVFICFALFYVLTKSQSKVLSLCVILLTMSSIILHKNDVFFIQKGSRTEWEKMSQWVKSKQVGSDFVNLRPTNHFNSYFDKNTVYFLPLSELLYLLPSYHSFSLNAPFIKENSQSIYASAEKVELELAPFSIYIKSQLKINPSLSTDDLMLKFVKEHKIDFISISNDTLLPQCFKPFVKDSINLELAKATIYQL